MRLDPNRRTGYLLEMLWDLWDKVFSLILVLVPIVIAMWRGNKKTRRLNTAEHAVTGESLQAAVTFSQTAALLAGQAVSETKAVGAKLDEHLTEHRTREKSL